jgi:hypothetical protein
LRQYETTSAIPNINLHLVLTIASDGAHVDGTIRLEEGSQTRRLVAQGTGQASCADVDGDGIAGLTRLVAAFRDTATQTSHRIVLSPVGADIDASEKRDITLEISGIRTFKGQAFIRVTPFGAR